MAVRVEFKQYGGPEVLELVEFELCKPGKGEVRVRNEAIGMNFIDIYYILLVNSLLGLVEKERGSSMLLVRMLKVLQ